MYFGLPQQRDTDDKAMQKLTTFASENSSVIEDLRSRNYKYIMDNYGFSQEFIKRFRYYHRRVIDFPSLINALYKVFEHLYLQENEGFFPKSYFKARNFSDKFIDAFERVAIKEIGRQDDILTLHFSGDMTLQDLMLLEIGVNKIYRQLLIKTTSSLERITDEEENIIRIRSFTHPGSTEVFLDPIVAGTISSVVAVGVYGLIEIMKLLKQKSTRKELIVARTLQSSNDSQNREEHAKIEIVESESLSSIEANPPEDSELFMIIIDSNIQNSQDFIIAKSADTVMGLENQEGYYIDDEEYYTTYY